MCWPLGHAGLYTETFVGSLKPDIKSAGDKMATIDPWFRLLLPSNGPGSNPKHTMNALQLVMFKLKLNWMLEREKDKNEAQRGRNWFIFKKISVKVINFDRRDTTTHKVRYF